MDPQNLLKHRLSRLFRSSFASCKSCYDVSGIIEHPVSTRQHYQLIELFSPRPHRPVFATCGPKWSEAEEKLPRRKVMDGYSLMCPPVSSFNTWHGVGRGRERKYSRKKNKGALVDDKKGRTREKRRNKATLWPTNNNYYYDWSSSDDDVDNDDDETTLFSSRSLTSDSSDSFRRSKSHHNRQIKQTNDLSAVGDGFAVVKRSSDPHSDFRTSMVEMIVEKQIFGAKELEGLLQTFLSLNACHHHRIIIEVFNEIWEALFSDWS